MNLPLDIPALLKAATDIDEARNTPLAVSVYIDETAPGDVVGHVRSAFASAGAKTRVTIGYLDDNLLAEPYGADDMAVIVAGDSPRIGEQAAHIRGAGIPVMVATTAPRAVAAAAEAAGWKWTVLILFLITLAASLICLFCVRKWTKFIQ